MVKKVIIKLINDLDSEDWKLKGQFFMCKIQTAYKLLVKAVTLLRQLSFISA